MNHKFEKRVKRIYAMLSCFVLVAVMTVCPAFAADDPLAVVTNLSDFIFSLIRAIGLILLGFGVLQLGLSLKSHDPSQRANGMLTIAGGIVITFTKEILTLIPGLVGKAVGRTQRPPAPFPHGGDAQWEVETGSLTT